MKNIQGYNMLILNVEDKVPGFLKTQMAQSPSLILFFTIIGNFLSLEKIGEGN